MEKLGLNEIREAYLKFFESKDHLRMKSFSLVPKNDPSLLLIPAGMAFKKIFHWGGEASEKTGNDLSEMYPHTRYRAGWQNRSPRHLL